MGYGAATCSFLSPLPHLWAEWAEQLTKMGRGKHFIGDFLPPDELEKFMETFKALKVTGNSRGCSLLLGQVPAVPSGPLAHRGR